MTLGEAVTSIDPDGYAVDADVVTAFAAHSRAVAPQYVGGDSLAARLIRERS
jgi:hypothetical protein